MLQGAHALRANIAALFGRVLSLSESAKRSRPTRHRTRREHVRPHRRHGARGRRFRQPLRPARRRPPRHLRRVDRHRLRVVRLLPVRLARDDHRAAVLLEPPRDEAVRLRAARVRGGVRGPALRRDRVRAHRRPRRPQVRVPRHHPHHGPLDDAPSGSSRRTRASASPRRSSSSSSGSCRASRSAASTAAPPSTSRSTRPRASAGSTRASSRRPPRPGCSCRCS